MTEGRIKWFNRSKGYRFIEDGGYDLFVRFSASEGNSFKTLSEGDWVSFLQGRAVNGLQATQVRKF